MRRDAIITAAGIAGGQGIVIFSTPILTSIYSPAAFGEYAAIVATASVIAAVSALRFDVAIPAVIEHDVLPLSRLALFLPLFVCLLLATMTRFIFPSISVYLGLPEYLMTIVFFVAMFQGTLAVCQGLLVREGAFTRSAVLRVIQPLGFVAVALIGTLKLSEALAASWALALLIALMIVRGNFLPVDIKRSITAARRAWRYPLVSAPLALLDTLSLALPLLFIVNIFGSQAAGNYSQVQRLIAAPLLLMGAATSQVFFKHAGDVFRQGENIEPLMWRVVATLGSLGVIFVAFVWLAGEPLMKFLLADGWRTDTKFVLLVTAPIVIRMAISPVTCSFLITNRLGLGGIWQLGYFIVTVSLLTIANGRLEFDEFLVVFAFCELFSYLCYLLLAVVAVRTALPAINKNVSNQP